MKLMKVFLREMAAGGSIGAGAIASYPAAGGKAKKKGKKSGLFAGGIISRTNEGEKDRRRGLRESDDFDEASVEAKLKSAEKIGQNKARCKVFGLEDDDGNTVKIYVAAKDAEEFERELESALNSDKSIAEIVFDLNREYDIIDAEWGNIPEDEETPVPEARPGEGKGAAQKPASDLGDETGEASPEDLGKKGSNGESDKDTDKTDADLGDLGDLGDEDLEGGKIGDMKDDEDVKSTLNQIIDMLKDDIEAKKAEAAAKKAEAEAKRAAAIRAAQESKARMDAELLDAEDFFKQKKEEERQRRQMEMLARYRHAISKGDDLDLDIPALEAASIKMANKLFENFKGQTNRFKKRGR
jgi:hypothetical protein